MNFAGEQVKVDPMKDLVAAKLHTRTLGAGKWQGRFHPRKHTQPGGQRAFPLKHFFTHDSTASGANR